jgi:hypothetical protein
MNLKLNAGNFKIGAKDKFQLTRKRVQMILQYVIYCYEKMCAEGKTYAKKDADSPKGKSNLEEFLNKKLVEDYLIPNLEYYQLNISDNQGVHVFFANESTQIYDDNKEDYIDIQVLETELNQIWADLKPRIQIHFAIECKILDNGYSEYVTDIEKMCNRNHTTFRLPFEGQIGYILNQKYTTKSVVSEINKNLKSKTTIKTDQYLEPIVKVDFDGSYLSIHKKNFAPNIPFDIYHLFLNYNAIVK